MKQLTYRQLPPIGSDDAYDPVTGSLADFVLDIPYLLSFDLNPPISVLNEQFGSGERYAAMSGGCVWKPFTITELEYEELTLELQNRGFQRVSPPEWVQNRTDWHIWIMEYEVGIPSEEHYRLLREEQTYAKLKIQAEKVGDQEGSLSYQLKALEAGQRLYRFTDPFIQKHRKKKNR
jgi:hypothetical protein